MSSSPHELERSLLQKAVRRGNEELTEKVVKYLTNVGDTIWLKNRFPIIVFEECWTYTGNHYNVLARTVKNKNAAGLGALAVKMNTSEDLAIRTVARGLDKSC